MKLINSDTMGIISEIKYDPNYIDKERFLVTHGSVHEYDKSKKMIRRIY